MNSPIYLLTGYESPRLRFRMVEPGDFDDWMEFCSDPDSLKYILPEKDQMLSPEEKCKKWFDKVEHRYTNALGGMNALIDKETNALIGQCGLLVQEIDGISELEIGYSIMPTHRNKGYASEAAFACKNYAFANRFADSLISIIHPENYASAKVAIANGMNLEKQSIHQNETINIYRIWK